MEEPGTAGDWWLLIAFASAGGLRFVQALVRAEPWSWEASVGLLMLLFALAAMGHELIRAVGSRP